MKSKYQLRHAKNLTASNVLPLAAEGWSAILQRGLGDTAAIPVNWEHSAVYFEYRGAPVALITHHFSEWNGLMWIHLGYVQPKHRKQGLYRALYNEVRKIAVEKGARAISSGIDRKNKAMIRAAESTGRSLEYVVYTENLPQKPEVVHA